MRNVSIISLFSSLISVSPCFLSSTTSNSYVIRNAYISKSLNSFFRINRLPNFEVSQSLFKHFLASPIHSEEIESQIYYETYTSNDQNISIINCQFIDCISKTPGAAIHIESPSSELLVKDSLFNTCRCEGKGGAIFAIMNHFTCTHNCFHLCRCGKEDGNDGSTIYASSKIGIDTSFVSAHECPKYGDSCWYGIIILCNGRLVSTNINVSNSEVEFISGLAHFRPAEEQSFLRYYTAVNQISGNPIAFIDFSFTGEHIFGSLVNNTSKTGIFYVQNTTTTLKNFYFANNTGMLTYMCVGDSKGYFENCFFDTAEGENLGIGFGGAKDCMWNVKNMQTPRFSHLSTAFCNGNNGSAKSDMIVVHILPKNTAAKTVTYLILAVIMLTLYMVVKKFIPRTSRFRNRE